MNQYLQNGCIFKEQHRTTLTWRWQITVVNGNLQNPRAWSTFQLDYHNFWPLSWSVGEAKATVNLSQDEYCPQSMIVCRQQRSTQTTSQHQTLQSYLDITLGPLPNTPEEASLSTQATMTSGIRGHSGGNQTDGKFSISIILLNQSLLW